jgi:putative addiction module killer protein
MSQEQWEIQIYAIADEVCPFDEWMETLDPQFQIRLDVRLDRVKLGNFGDRKSVGEGVFELRFTFGPGFRVYYGIVGKQIVLLLIGGSKKNQDKDIKTAQKFWKAYQDDQQHKGV